MDRRKALLLRRQRLIEQLPPLEEMVRGSLFERRLRCGRVGCHCAQGEGHRVWYLTVSFAGRRTEQVTVPPALVPRVRQWVRNYGRWWAIVEEVSAINRQLLRRRWLEGGKEER
jgi:hypothetical protein